MNNLFKKLLDAAKMVDQVYGQEEHLPTVLMKLKEVIKECEEMQPKVMVIAMGPGVHPHDIIKEITKEYTSILVVNNEPPRPNIKDLPIPEIKLTEHIPPKLEAGDYQREQHRHRQHHHKKKI